MNKQTLIWTLIVAVPVGLVALATAYFYRDTGHLPFQKPAETVSAPAAQSDQGDGKTTTAGADVKPSEAGKPEETATAPEQESQDGQSGSGPSFDVVGVEPTGETVVAGRSDAGAIVALTANGEVVGKSIANEAGEWTIILDEPLKPGDYDVGLEVHDEKGESIESSDQRLAVSVPEGGKEQPLVVLNSSDGPSDILQKPADEPKVATAEDKPAEETQVATTADQNPDVPAKSDETVVAAVETNTPASQPAQQSTQEANAPAANTPAKEETASAVVEAPAAGTDATTPAPVETKPEVTAVPAPADTANVETSAPAETAEAPENTGQETQVAATSTQETQSAPQTQTETVANTQAPADASAPATQTADVVPEAKPETGGQTGQTADASTAAPQGSQEKPAEPAQIAAADAQAEPPVPAPTVTVEAVESEKDKVFVAGTGEPGSSVRVYVGDDYQGEAEVNSSGKWLLEGDKNVPEGNVEVRADLVGDDGNTVDARAAVTFEKEAEKQIVLTKVVATGTGGGSENQGAAVQKALPVVIIRKGDNLWRISRRLYGDGVRYTTIYQANQDQIRDPDLIYPGQVFLTPEGDLSWPKPKEDG